MAATASPRLPPALPKVFQAVIAPLQAFFALQAAGGLALLAATLVALVWANSPWREGYEALVGLPLQLTVGGAPLAFTLQEAVNDGLMTLFFFLVGMEIKRELVAGELQSGPQAMLPLAAAVGGMAVPALLYFSFNAGGPGASGWGIPMATDIAFAIGVLTTLRRRVPPSLVVFLLALAVFDDLGGILVIALFYGGGFHLAWLAAAFVVVAGLLVAARFRLTSGLAYLLFGVALWWTMHHAGVHATLAGVVLGLAIPARPLRAAREVLAELRDYASGCIDRAPQESLENEELLQIEEKIEDLEAPLNRFVHMLHPYVAFAIVPLFALVNAGVPFAGASGKELTAPVFLGIFVGLVLGKPIGIFLTTVLAHRFARLPLPNGARLSQVGGVGVVAGIGFTVSLFIAQLAFASAPVLLAQAKLAILVGSLVSAVVGWAWLRFAGAPAK